MQLAAAVENAPSCCTSASAYLVCVRKATLGLRPPVDSQDIHAHPPIIALFAAIARCVSGCRLRRKWEQESGSIEEG